MSEHAGRAGEVYRDDGELIGQLRESEPGLWVPCAVFGSPLATPRSRAAAEAFLLGNVLGYLAERWEAREGEDWVTVRIVEARPGEVTVSYADYGRPDLFNSRRTLTQPSPSELRMG